MKCESHLVGINAMEVDGVHLKDWHKFPLRCDNNQIGIRLHAINLGFPVA